MGRPRKQTVDYFPHFVSTDSRTRFILEQSWGNDGYAFWFKLLELLCRSEGHYYDLSEAANGKYLEALMKVDGETSMAILNTLADLGSIDRDLWEERKVVWCQSLVDNLQDVYSKRTVSAPVRPFTEGQPEEAPEPEPPTRKRGRPPKAPEDSQTKGEYATRWRRSTTKSASHSPGLKVCRRPGKRQSRRGWRTATRWRVSKSFSERHRPAVS